MHYPISVTKYNPSILEIKNIKDAKEAIKEIGSDPESIDIMAPKAISKVIKLESIVLQDAIIIKQDMLSIGGEVAVPKDTFKLLNKTGDVLIIGTLKQLNELVKKLARHYLRLKEISKELENILRNVN